MSTKILLICTCWEEESLITSASNKKLEVHCTDSSHYPLGIGYLHSFLEQRGNEVETLWLNNYDFDTCFSLIFSKIDQFIPDIIGFQILTTNRTSSFKIIEYVHQHYPEIIQIIGGIHATIMYDQILRKYPYLIAVLGEGELTFGQLADELFSENKRLEEVKGIAFVKNNSVLKTDDRDLIDNLDILPFPKHELFFNNLRENACIITSRGCPNKCSFCCLCAVSNRKVRYRSIENVIEEIEYLKNKFPKLKQIWIHDDSFFLNNDRVIKFCDEVISRKILVEFVCSGRFKPISEKMVKKLEQANFVQVLLGLESGDENILKACHKNITTEDALKAVKLFAETKIEIYAFIIIGLPGENKQSIITTSQLIQKMQKIKYMYYKNVALLTIYPGTEIYEIAKRSGKIDDDYWLTDKITPLYNVEHSEKELFEYKDIMLDYISYDRLLSINGFSKQFWLMPHALRFIFVKYFTWLRDHLIKD